MTPQTNDREATLRRGGWTALLAMLLGGGIMIYMIGHVPTPSIFGMAVFILGGVLLFGGHFFVTLASQAVSPLNAAELEELRTIAKSNAKVRSWLGDQMKQEVTPSQRDLQRARQQDEYPAKVRARNADRNERNSALDGLKSDLNKE